jgi:hypothetical protein
MSALLPFYSDAQTPRWLVSSNVAYNVGDLLYDSGSGGIALPAGSQASQGSEQADQVLFASKFCGVCVSGCSAAEALYNTAFPIVVDMSGKVWSVTCPSQTWNHGDLVGIYSNGTTSPDPQKVDACGQNGIRAIGKVFGYYPTAVTQVQVVFFPKGYNALTSPAGLFTLVLTPITAAAFAIPPHTAANYIITRAAADLMTLAAPTATVDDGLVIVITSGTAFAHTITTVGLLNTGSANVNTATFAANAGAGLTLMAWQGKWNILYSTGVTFS